MNNLGKTVKVFISQPMGGHTLEEIMETRRAIIKQLESIYENGGVEVVDNITPNMDYITDNMMHPGLWYFAESLKLMVGVNFVIFADGWQDSVGCRLEHEITKAFDIQAVSVKEIDLLNAINRRN